MTTWHVYMSIESAERMSDEELESMFQGRSSAIRTNLTLMKAQGLEVIPSAGCDKKDATGYCLGH
jgi:hypothetical protein